MLGCWLEGYWTAVQSRICLYTESVELIRRGRDVIVIAIVPSKQASKPNLCSCRSAESRIHSPESKKATSKLRNQATSYFPSLLIARAQSSKRQGGKGGGTNANTIGSSIVFPLSVALVSTHVPYSMSFQGVSSACGTW
jgi:hypothetical protein